MELLNEAIRRDGKVFPNQVLKVDTFINHQIDAQLMAKLAEAFHQHFNGRGVTKVLTVEASGIAPAILVALAFGVPLVFAKKALPATLFGEPVYETEIFSYTKQVASRIVVSQQLLSADDRILIIDDFLANGEAVLGLQRLADQAGATVVGVGILIEKSFQSGRQKLEDAGLDVYSLSRLAAIAPGDIQFVE